MCRIEMVEQVLKEKSQLRLSTWTLGVLAPDDTKKKVLPDPKP